MLSTRSLPRFIKYTACNLSGLSRLAASMTCRRTHSSPGQRRVSLNVENGDGDRKWDLPPSFGAFKEDTNVQERNRIQASHLPPMSISDGAVELELRHGSPAKIFRNCVNNGTVSVHVVRMCLSTQRNEVARKSRQDREPLLAAQREEGLARMILRQIWKSDMWLPIVFFDPRTVEVLSYYAILEGLEDVLLEWMIMPTPDTALEGRGNLWRGSLLRQIVAAHVYLDTNADAGPALKCCIKASKQKDAANAANTEPNRRIAESNNPILGISIRPAIVEMYATLCTPYCYNTDPALFEEFMSVYTGRNGIRRNRVDATYGASRMRLWHPAQPDERDAIDLLHRHAQHGADDGTVIPLRSSALMTASFQKYLQRTIDVATHNGNSHHVKWVKQVHKELLKPGGNFDIPTEIGRPKAIPISLARTRANSLNEDERSPEKMRVPFPTFT